MLAISALLLAACTLSVARRLDGAPSRVCACTPVFVTVLVLLQADAALRTALRLRQYDDVLDPADVYAFLALVGFYSNFYGTCSKVGDSPKCNTTY
jgi:hypothetical protein